MTSQTSVAEIGIPAFTSNEPGLCGGGGATCSSASQCLTGACRANGKCIPWGTPLNVGVGGNCDYSVQCESSLVCVDD